MVNVSNFVTIFCVICHFLKTITMKSIFALSFIFWSNIFVNGQCMIEPWSLTKRVNHSTVVVEGRVVDQYGIWDMARKNIYTINTIEVYKVLKGTVHSSTIILVTEGGRVGLEMLTVSPSLELQHGQVGIFLLTANTVPFQNLTAMYKPAASVQSFILYDLHQVEAYDREYIYTDIKNELYVDIQAITGEVITEVKEFDAEAGNKRIRALSPPIISSFSLDTSSSGTSTELTIFGSNFGFARGSGKVGFKDANFGDGRYYYSPTSWSYVLWSNTQIKVTIPSRAGTGAVQVITNSGESGESAANLSIDWSHLNVNYPLNASDTPFFELQHINSNNLGGYTWSMTTGFALNQPAVDAFTRSMNEWKCKTEMNWTLGSNTTNHDLANDQVNTVRWTSYTDSRLGVCYSRYQGCFTGGGTDMSWFVSEIDIEFDSTRSWYFGVLSPSSNQFDFESVATHELGHGHQLGHVRNSAKVMHFSIGNGQRKPNLVDSDIAAGNYVKNKSAANAICGRGKMSVAPCPSVPPIAAIDVSQETVCPKDTTTVSSISVGQINQWKWYFGDSASLDSAHTEGPHGVSYTSSGNKTIVLIVSNDAGADTATKTILVKMGELNKPKAFVVQDTACKEQIIYTVEPVLGANSYQWNVLSGGAIVDSAESNVTIEWQDTGLHTITVKALGDCEDGPMQEDTVFVLSEPIADFTFLGSSITLNFKSELNYTESFLWDFGDGFFTDEENPTYRFADKGIFTVKLTANNRCGQITVEKEVAAEYGASIVERFKNTRIYPNPLKLGEELTIDGALFETYKLYNQHGKLVQQGRAREEKIMLNVSSAGLLLLVLSVGQQSVSYKINVVK